MYSPGIVSMYTQAVQAEIEREIENYQLIKAEGKPGRPSLSARLVQRYCATFEKVYRFSNSERDEIKVAECS